MIWHIFARCYGMQGAMMKGFAPFTIRPWAKQSFRAYVSVFAVRIRARAPWYLLPNCPKVLANSRRETCSDIALMQL